MFSFPIVFSIFFHKFVGWNGALLQLGDECFQGPTKLLRVLDFAGNVGVFVHVSSSVCAVILWQCSRSSSVSWGFKALLSHKKHSRVSRKWGFVTWLKVSQTHEKRWQWKIYCSKSKSRLHNRAHITLTSPINLCHLILQKTTNILFDFPPRSIRKITNFSA